MNAPAPRRRQVLVALPALLSACVSVRVGEDTTPHTHLRLVDDAVPMPARETSLVPALLVQALPGDALADTQSIAYARAPHQFAFYALSSWTERPVRAIPRLLQRRVQAAGVAGAVGLLGDPLRADWLLTLSIDTVHHDLSSDTPQARLAMTLTLVDRRRRTSVAQQQFGAQLSSGGADAAHAADAMSRAVSQLLDAIVPWLERALVAAMQAR